MPDPNEIPVNHVVNMRTQGLTNNQIIQNLQRFGYSIEQINNAINQADIKSGIYSPMPETAGRERHAPAKPAQQQFSAAPSGPSPLQGDIGPPEAAEDISEEEERIHEVAEAIIEEKWAELMDSVNRIIEWKDHIEERLSKAEQQLTGLSANFDRLHEGVLGKIHDYDKGLTTVTTEIKALEKVFQKILPGFVENVHELSRITESLKKK